MLIIRLGFRKMMQKGYSFIAEGMCLPGFYLFAKVRHNVFFLVNVMFGLKCPAIVGAMVSVATSRLFQTRLQGRRS